MLMPILDSPGIPTFRPGASTLLKDHLPILVIFSWKSSLTDQGL